MDDDDDDDGLFLLNGFWLLLVEDSGLSHAVKSFALSHNISIYLIQHSLNYRLRVRLGMVSNIPQSFLGGPTSAVPGPRPQRQSVEAFQKITSLSLSLSLSHHP